MAVTEHEIKKTRFFTYKDRPLVRKGDTLYYGNMFEDYVIMLTIKDHKKFEDLSLAGNVHIQMMRTDPTVPPQEMIVKKSDKAGLYNALDIASIWLDRAIPAEH